jgi:hypothetical protein
LSEYQHYEFVALDRPLDARAQAEVRALSTRARITATSFVDEYEWGDFRGDPNRPVAHRFQDISPEDHRATDRWSRQPANVEPPPRRPRDPAGRSGTGRLPDN